MSEYSKLLHAFAMKKIGIFAIMRRLGQFLGFLFLAPVIFVISILPFRILYVISDFFYFLIYRVVGYRKAVVRKNLSLAFPEKTEEERLDIERKFYRHLADLFLEMIKSFGISQEAMSRRFRIENPEVLENIYNAGKSVIVYGGHQGNWEWVIGTRNQLKHRPMAIYKQLANPFMNRFMLRTRTKFGFDFVPTFRARNYIDEKEKAGEKTAYGFLGDQNPLPHKAKLWYPFFGHDVPAYTGAEEIAKTYDIPIVFLEIVKAKRGHYRAKLRPLALQPKEYPDFQITERYFYLLEESIRRQPEMYYWIHRRFKHTPHAEHYKNRLKKFD